MDDLTERVARALHARIAGKRRTYDEDSEHVREWLRGDARAALAVVADDVDGLAGVLRDHEAVVQAQTLSFRCNTCRTHLSDRAATQHHMAAMVAAHIRGDA